MRAVRLEAVAVLAGIAPDAWPPEHRSAFERASAEYVAAQELNADRPEAHLNLALLYAGSAPQRAEPSLKRALEIDPIFVPAAVNLADYYRSAQREPEAEKVLREALGHLPDNASLLEALGLTLVREKRASEALEILGKAARLAPDHSRAGYLHAVALHDHGRRADAIRELERVITQHPYDRDTLSALAAFLREAGETERAIAYAARMQALAIEGE